MKKKVCKKCKVITDGNECPQCKSNNQFATSWQGRIIILDSSKSIIGQKISAASNQEYAIKVR